MITRSEAERDLNRLLKRALQSVPFVRLDKVEEVTEKFKVACSLLEDNLEDDNFDLNAEEDDGADEIVNIPRSMPVETGKPDLDSDEDEEEDDEEEKERERKEREQKELEDRESRILPKAGEAIRKDFSSPDIRSRGLKGMIPSGTTGTEDSRKVGSSSRAGLSSRAKPAVEGSEGSKPLIGLKGASSRARGGGGGGGQNDLRKQVIVRKKKPSGDVAVSKDRFTKDEGTPRLGARSLGKSSSDLLKSDDIAASSRDATFDSPSTESLGRAPKKLSSRAGGGTTSSVLPSNSSSNSSSSSDSTDFYRDDSDNNEETPSILTSTSSIASATSNKLADLVGGKHGKNPSIDRVTETILDVPHSPLQLNAHRTLLKIAQQPVITSEEIIPISQKVETPKPAFLRRLDSPKTNHGILIAHKTRLNKMLRRSLRAIPHMKQDKYEQIKVAFLQAVELLEQSTTMALAKKENVVMDPSTSRIVV